MTHERNAFGELVTDYAEAFQYSKSFLNVFKGKGLESKSKLVNMANSQPSVGSAFRGVTDSLKLRHSSERSMGWTPQLGQRRGQVKRDSRWKV